MKTVQCIESESPPTTHTHKKKLVFSEVKKKKKKKMWSAVIFSLMKHLINLRINWLRIFN